MLADPPRPAGLALDRVGERADRRRALAERQRVQVALAETGVGQPALTVEVHQQRHVVGRPVAPDHGLVVGHDEADRAQQRGEHGVELEAVAAAPVLQEPRRQRRLVERRGLAQLHGQVLVGHAADESAVHAEQAIDVRRRRTIQSDPGQQPLDHPPDASRRRYARALFSRAPQIAIEHQRPERFLERSWKTPRQDSRSQALKRSNSPAQIASCSAATISPQRRVDPLGARHEPADTVDAAPASASRAAPPRRSPPRRPRRTAARCWRRRASAARHGARGPP